MMKMLRTLSILILALALLVQGSTQAQDVTGRTSITARGKGTKLVLKSRGKSHVFDVREQVDAAKLDDVSVLFETRRTDFTYLLIAACGSSKLKPDDHECGAGVECNLLWVKLSADWKIGDLKSVRYESCWAPVSSFDGYKITGRHLQVEYYNLREKLNYKLTYDADQPESGWAIETSPIKDEGSN